MLSKGRQVIPFSLISLAVGLVGFAALLIARFPPDYSTTAPVVEVLAEAESAATTAPASATSAPATTTSTSTTPAANADEATVSTTTSAPTTTVAPTTSVEPTTVSVGPSTYRIEQGDTLNELAVQFEVSVAELVALNNIANPNLIFTGQVLRISTGTEQSVSYGLTGFDRSVFQATAAAVDLETELLEAVAWVASRWDASAEEEGVGIGQLTPDIHDFVERDLVGRELDATNVEESVEAMGNYLAWLFGQAGGETSSALAAYYEDLLTARNIGWSQDTLDFVDEVRNARRQFVLANQNG